MYVWVTRIHDAKRTQAGRCTSISLFETEGQKTEDCLRHMSQQLSQVSIETCACCCLLLFVPQSLGLELQWVTSATSAQLRKTIQSALRHQYEVYTKKLLLIVSCVT